jgi:glycosyltransferase involved in cell wall biosynthesis
LQGSQSLNQTRDTFHSIPKKLKRIGVYNGDIHQWLIDLCNELSLGRKVYLFGAGNWNVYPWDASLEHLERYSYKMLTVPGWKPFPSPKLFLGLARSKCEAVIILTVESTPALAFYYLSKFLGVKRRMVIVEDNHRPSSTIWDSMIWRIKKPFIACMYKTANILVAESTASVHYLQKEFRVSPSRVLVLPHGVKTNRFRKGDFATATNGSKCVLLFAGELGKKKGADILIDAIGILVSEYGLGEKILVRMRRSGNLTRDREFASKMNNLIHLGVVKPYQDMTNEEMIRLHLNADIIIVPSRLMERESSDRCPNTLLEALASGKPIVATPVGGIPSIARDSVLYVEPNNPRSLADGIRILLTDPTLRNKLARKAWLRGTELDMRTYGQNILKMLES